MRRASEEPDAPEEHGAERRASEYQDELLGAVAAALGRTVRDGAQAAVAAAQLAAETGRARAKAARGIADAVGAEVREAVRKAVRRAETPGNPVSGIDGRDDAKRASQRASSMVDAAARNANLAYWEALQRVRNSANRSMGFEDALRTEVARLAREGVTAYSYRRRNPDGTYSIVKVPVDVGLRREIATAGIRAANEASLEAAANGGGLVEVSCTANPRKSHRAWEGRVYRVADPDPSSPLYAAVMRYPRFVDVVGSHIQDYNCRHQVRPWREGQPRWRDPLEGTGYTPEKGSRIMGRQAQLENEVRKAKREVEALTAAGLDAAEAKRRLTARRRQVKALVAEHPKLLERRPWREGIYEGARKADGTYGRVHLGRESFSFFAKAAASQGAEMTRKASPHRYVRGDGHQVAPKALFDKTLKTLRKKGGDLVIASEEHLDRMAATGSAALNYGRFAIVRKDATVSEILEEAIHVEQFLAGKNAEHETYLMFLLNEIDAQERLLSLTEKYRIPPDEVEQTRRNLDMYRRQLAEYERKNGSVDHAGWL